MNYEDTADLMRGERTVVREADDWHLQNPNAEREVHIRSDETEARALEIVHFANDEDARNFETAFRSYLVPGLPDGPELAPEAAKLEGLSGRVEQGTRMRKS